MLNSFIVFFVFVIGIYTEIDPCRVRDCIKSLSQ